MSVTTPPPITQEEVDRCLEIREAIQDLFLGSIEEVVIEAAQNALLDNWSDHNRDT